MDPFDPPPNARHRIEADGELYIWQVRSDIVIEKGIGTFSLPLAQFVTDFMRPLLTPGRGYVFFGDFERLASYTGEAREHMSRFATEHLSAIGVVHFLISAKFVALGLSSFKQDIGTERARFYAERGSFTRSYRAALGENAGT